MTIAERRDFEISSAYQAFLLHWREQTARDHRDVALFSSDMEHRFVLVRHVFDDGEGTCTFVMLNPSTADAFVNDPTVAKCVKHARRWGFRSLAVVNLFSLRTPYPTDLLDHKWPGNTPANTIAIRYWASIASRVVCAWGSNGWYQDRGAEIASILRADGRELYHLGFTLDGYPKHPLARGKAWIPTDVEATRWEVT